LLQQIAIDDANIYFFNEDGIYNDLLCKVSKQGGEAVTLDGGYSSGIIALGKTEIFFVSGDDIFSFTK
jgi:hypothetical protein